MPIRVLFFASLADVTGVREADADPSAFADVASLFAHFERRFPALAPHRKSLLYARNGVFVDPDEPVADGDEVAFLPPVSGGAGPERFRLVREPIDSRALRAGLTRPEDGAVVLFEGTVRNHARGRKVVALEYHAYESMALRQLEEVGARTRSGYEVRDVAIVHRLGRLDPGETSVAIVVAAAHRIPAFAACRFAIDTLKQIVPIWKKEYYEDGGVWIEGGN
jgi:molybdopterin synthase catalytic subunit